MLPSTMLDARVSSGRYSVGRSCLTRTIARCPSVTQPADTPVPMPAITSSRYKISAAGRLRAPARRLLVLAVVAGASLGLVRPTTSQATVAAPASKQQEAVAATSRKPLRLRAWRYAMHQRGKPYVWGGTGPYGFDCSGLVYASYRSQRLTLPRTTQEMLHSKYLVRVRKSKARRGDLAFFGSGHVELYDRGKWTYGAAAEGTRIGFHRMNSFWHPTMYFRVRR